MIPSIYRILRCNNNFLKSQVFCKICWTDHIVELEGKLSTLLRQLEDSESRLGHKLEYKEGRCDQLKENIKTTAIHQIDIIQELEKGALEKVENLRNDHKSAAQEMKKRIKDLKDNITQKYPKTPESHKVHI